MSVLSDDELLEAFTKDTSRSLVDCLRNIEREILDNLIAEYERSASRIEAASKKVNRLAVAMELRARAYCLRAKRDAKP